jgi:hypothetical protein
MLGIELRALHRISKCSITELQPQPTFMVLKSIGYRMANKNWEVVVAHTGGADQ